jgi:dTDP-4-amino-4,6-dideoxygalactose transaminase
MPSWQKKRFKYAQKIWSFASTLPGVRVPKLPDTIQHAAYKCYVFIKPEELAEGWNRERILSAIREQGVPCYMGSCSEIYLEKAFDNMGCRPEKRLPVAQRLGETSLMFLVHPTLSIEEIEKTCHALKEVMLAATEKVV